MANGARWRWWTVAVVSAVLVTLVGCTVGLPPTPYNVRASVHASGAVDVGWLQGKNPNNNPIFGYKLTPFVNGVAQEPILTESVDTWYRVEGLPAGAAVSFRVAAYNDKGTGASAEQSNVVIAGPPAASPPVGVGVGAMHACSVRADGTVSCWGTGSSGQLGNGRFVSSTEPVTVLGIDDAVAVAATAKASCALRTGGRVSCWGDNYEGVLGTGAAWDFRTAVPLDLDLAGFSDLKGGGGQFCALRDGAPYCWGMVYQTIPWGAGRVSTPQDLSQGRVTDAVYVDAQEAWGGVTCVLRSGSQDISCYDVPAPIPTVMSAPRQFVAFEWRCGLDLDGAVWCPPAGPDQGPSAWSPLPGLAGVTKMVGEGPTRSVCALSPAGVQCWGSNSDGQLGDGTTIDSAAPVAALGTVGATDLDVSTTNACAVVPGPTIRCWGNNSGGQLGPYG